MDESLRPGRFPGFFLLSLPRTGSTLLRLLLDSHPEIYAPDELNLGRLLQALYYTQEGITESIGTSALRGIDPVGAPAAATRRIVLDLLAAAAAAKGKTFWCDKSPSNIDCLPLLEEIIPEASHLILHRHALDFAASCLQLSAYGFNLAVVEDYVRKEHRFFLRALIQAWTDKTEELLEFERQRPERCYRVLYEDLVSEPAATLEHLCAWLGVEHAPDLTVRAFSSPHHQRAFQGGDDKAYYSTGIVDTSIGRGAGLSVDAIRLVPAALLQRMNALLAELSYPAVEISDHGIDLHLPSPQAAGCRAAWSAPEEHAASAERFFSRLDRRLRDKRAPEDLSGKSFAFLLTGKGGGCWTVDLTQPSAQVRHVRDTANVVLTMAAVDFAEIISGRLNPGLASQQEKIKIDGGGDPALLRGLATLLLAPE